ncbi:hypothetical protein BBK82_36070 [Lentzea guizhouensis]|uniref:Uncharacterized protein n=1 Tax=Lentzea guizhouensis TaxID=1586287 RepID=A0A1B2HSB2_9PSEU|nr:hypothetical protein BBK82_36070 [Lentzea guizhouensis]
MPDLAVTLLHDTSHLGRTRLATFAQFLATVQSLAKEGDSYYRYPALEMALQATGHLAESG